MFTDKERDAVVRWYSEPQVLERARELYEAGQYEPLEEYLHKTCLIPLGRHDELPDYMRNDNGKPLFKNNLSPIQDEEQWKDAIEIAWEVMRDRCDIDHDEIHRTIAAAQKDDWQAFLESIERRKRERGADD